MRFPISSQERLGSSDRILERLGSGHGVLESIGSQDPNIVANVGKFMIRLASCELFPTRIPIKPDRIPHRVPNRLPSWVSDENSRLFKTSVLLEMPIYRSCGYYGGVECFQILRSLCIQAAPVGHITGDVRLIQGSGHQHLREAQSSSLELYQEPKLEGHLPHGGQNLPASSKYIFITLKACKSIYDIYSYTVCTKYVSKTFQLPALRLQGTLCLPESET